MIDRIAKIEEELIDHDKRLLAFFHDFHGVKDRVEQMERDLQNLKFQIEQPYWQDKVSEAQERFDKNMKEIKSSLGPKLQEEIEKRKRYRK